MPENRCPQCEFVAYFGQDPPPWEALVEQPPVRWWTSRRRLMRWIHHLEDGLAWERWKLQKVVHDYKLAEERSDGGQDGD